MYVQRLKRSVLVNSNSFSSGRVAALATLTTNYKYLFSEQGQPDWHCERWIIGDLWRDFSSDDIGGGVIKTMLGELFWVASDVSRCIVLIHKLVTWLGH